MKTAAMLIRKLQSATMAFLALVLAAMMCVIFVQTFTRYVVFHSIPWSEELSRYLFVALVCLGVNVGVTKDLMIRIDNIDARLSERMRHWFDVGRLAVELAISVFLLISSFDIIRIGKFQKSPALQIPMSYIYALMAAGFGLAIISILLKLAETLRRKEG